MEPPSVDEGGLWAAPRAPSPRDRAPSRSSWRRDGRPLGVLIVTKVFPNALEPQHSVYNLQQFTALARRCSVDVLANVPWFPGCGLLGERTRAGRLRALPIEERVDGVRVRHPRTLYVPRVGLGAGAALHVLSHLGEVARFRGRVDVVLGSWAFPDGAAAVVLGKLLGVPAVVKVHGSDINVVAQLPQARRQLELLLPRARRVVAVSRALARSVEALGVPHERVCVVRNGVDGELFFPRDKASCRRHLGLVEQGQVALFVGRLERAKGVLDACEAFARVAHERPGLRLVIVGGGSAEAECRAFARGWPGRVVVAGERPLHEVPLWMGASDLLVLPSFSEGTPNVMLESFTAGRPVLASRVGGIPDLMTGPTLGRLVDARDVPALARELCAMASATFDVARVVSQGSPGTWDDSAGHLLDVLEDAVLEARSERDGA